MAIIKADVFRDCCPSPTGLGSDFDEKEPGNEPVEPRVISSPSVQPCEMKVEEPGVPPAGSFLEEKVEEKHDGVGGMDGMYMQCVMLTGVWSNC